MSTPTSSFTINQTPSSDNSSADATFDAANPSQNDFSPIIYPSDLLKDNDDAGRGKIVPFIGFYVMLPKSARAVTDNGEAFDDATTSQYLTLRGLDYAEDVNKDASRVTSAVNGTDLKDLAGALLNVDTTKFRIRIYRRINVLKKFICLYMPETLNSDLSAQYSNYSVGPAVATAGAISDILKNLTSSKSLDGATSPFTNLVAAMSSQGGIIGGLGVAGKYVQAGQGTALNPLTEMFFENMNFRQFTLDFKFVPKSRKEADAVLEIIKTFRMYMVPEINKDATAGIYMSVPAFFQIKYYIQQDGQVSENPNLPKISGCVLTGLTTDFAPDGQALHRDGMPVVTRLTLSFTELEIMHRDRINQGY